MIDLTEPETEEFLQSGPSLMACTVDGEGRPYISRLFGLTIVEAEHGLIRILVQANASITLADIGAGRAVAVTATNVTNFHSLQFKGVGVSVEDLTAADEAKQAAYTDALVADVHMFNPYPIDVLRRFADRATIPCLITVDSSFDQTPGPSAGSAIDRSSS